MSSDVNKIPWLILVFKVDKGTKQEAEDRANGGGLSSGGRTKQEKEEEDRSLAGSS